jgi:hypothetical protein
MSRSNRHRAESCAALKWTAACAIISRDTDIVQRLSNFFVMNTDLSIQAHSEFVTYTPRRPIRDRPHRSYRPALDART